MITINKILCPVDFFPASDAAVSYAVGLGANYDATIHLLHVITPILPNEYAIDTVEIMKSMEKSTAEEMKKLVARVKEAGVTIHTEIRTGDVYDEIKQAIEVVKPELVVMGTHGRRGVERWFMGSTTEKLMRHSPVPMLTISVWRKGGCTRVPANSGDNRFLGRNTRGFSVRLLCCPGE